MSPEKLQMKECGPASDMWAAGVILYELFTGVHPFDQSVDGILTKAPHPLPAHVPPVAASLIMNLLDKD